MASGVHKNTDTKVETVSANSVCRQLPQKTAEQGLAAAVAFAEEVQWSLAIRRTISGVGFGEALKLLMNDRDMSVEQMESESGLSVSALCIYGKAASCRTGCKCGADRCHLGGTAPSATCKR